MARALLMYMVIMAAIAGLIFGYKSIKKRDVKVAGKLVFAAIISLIVVTVIFILEN